LSESIDEYAKNVLKYKGIEFPLLSLKPGLFIVSVFRKRDLVVDFIIRILKGNTFTDIIPKIFIEEFLEGKYYFVIVVLTTNNENTLKDLENFVKDLFEEFQNPYYEIKRLEKYGRIYLIPLPQKVFLLGERLVFIRESRFLAMVKTLLNTLGTGFFSQARMAGEDDGRVIYRTHKDLMEDMISRGELIKIIEYITVGLSYLNTISQVDISIDLSGDIVIKLNPSENRIESVEIEKHYLYGVLNSIFSGLGYKTEYKISKELDSVSCLIVYLPEKPLKIRILTPLVSHL